MSLAAGHIIGHHTWAPGRKTDIGDPDLTDDRTGSSDIINATTDQGADDMADPQVIAALDAIRAEQKRTADVLTTILVQGFRGANADGTPAPTAENNSVRGVNAALDQQIPLLNRIATAVETAVAGTDPTPPPSASASR